MRRATAPFLGLAVLLFASAVSAEEDALTKNCMGGEDPRQNPERAEYCACMSQSMAQLSAQDFREIAEEAAKARSAGQEPVKLQELAKACITKVMGRAPQ